MHKFCAIFQNLNDNLLGNDSDTEVRFSLTDRALRAAHLLEKQLLLADTPAAVMKQVSSCCIWQTLRRLSWSRRAAAAFDIHSGGCREAGEQLLHLTDTPAALVKQVISCCIWQTLRRLSSSKWAAAAPGGDFSSFVLYFYLTNVYSVRARCGNSSVWLESYPGLPVPLQRGF